MLIPKHASGRADRASSAIAATRRSKIYHGNFA
jgi:hypothetical protein